MRGGAAISMPCPATLLYGNIGGWRRCKGLQPPIKSWSDAPRNRSTSTTARRGGGNIPPWRTEARSRNARRVDNEDNARADPDLSARQQAHPLR